MSLRRRGLVLLLATVAVACGRDRPGATRLVRLGPTEGLRYRQVGAATRPFVVLRPGEAIRERVPGRGGQLAFAWTVSGGRRQVRLEVTLDGKTLYTGRGTGTETWQEVTLPVEPGRGDAQLELRAFRRGASAELMPAVAVTPLRLYETTPARKRRVLVWLSLDTVRADHLGLYGYPRPTSPVLDRLAAGAVVFENAVAPSSWTLPSVASQFTSRYPSFHGAVLQKVRLDQSQPTVFESLSREGFTVLGVTANPFLSAHFGLSQGFDLLVETKGSAPEVNRLAVQALDAWPGGDLVLFVHYMDPHTPYEPPKPFDSMFASGYKGRINGYNFRMLKPGAPARDVAQAVALYDGELAALDQALGALLAELRSRGLLDEAVLVVTADHGEELLDHGSWMHSRTLYEEVLRVPLLVSAPGLAARRVGNVVSLVDLAPTLLDLLAVASPPTFQGRNLGPLLRNGTLPEQAVFAETERNRDGLHRVAVRAGAHKLVLGFERGASAPGPAKLEESYDLAADPAERSPRPASAAPDRLRREIDAFLARARSEARRGAAADVPQEVEQALDALGYVQ